MRLFRILPIAALVLILGACAVGRQAPACPPGTQDLPGCPPAGAVDDPEINEIFASRTWVPDRELEQDLIELGKAYEIPVQHARTKFLGPDDHAAIDSLAKDIADLEIDQPHVLGGIKPMLGKQHAAGKIHRRAKGKADAFALQLLEAGDAGPGHQPLKTRGNVLVADPVETRIALGHGGEHGDLAEAGELGIA